VACVVTQSPATQEELIHWCRQELAHFKCPRAVLFVDELPKTATGKLQRFKVRELVAESARPTLAQSMTMESRALTDESSRVLRRLHS
jgi:acyl-coenzyme A synthetase/AMP-(fatty) acid ligase